MMLANSLGVCSNEDEISGFDITEENDVHDAEVSINVSTDDLMDSYSGAVEIQISSKVIINIDGMPSKLITALKRIATFANPKFFELQRLRFSTWKTPKYIFCGEVAAGKLILPKGTLEKVQETLINAGSDISILDRRSIKKYLELSFSGVLKEEQEVAVSEISKYDFGVLVAPTGFGKTIVACKIISQRKVPTLILVHRKQLVKQWKNQIASFLSIQEGEIGIISGGKKKASGKIDIATYQTLSKMKSLADLTNVYAQIIIDECHRIPAVSFEAVVNEFPIKYCLGLTATPFRKDGHQPILYMQCGPIRYEVKEKALHEARRRVIVKATSFRMPPEFDPQPPIHEIWNCLVEDEDRLQLIVDDVFSSLEEKRRVLVLSERKNHLYDISDGLEKLMRGFRCTKHVLTGDLSKKKMEQVFSEIEDSISEEKAFCILSTGSLIGEGFDLPELDTLVLAMPISFKGRLIQYAGRIHREHRMKREVIIHDYVDTQALTISMFKKRVKTYKKMRYSIETGNSPEIGKWI